MNMFEHGTTCMNMDKNARFEMMSQKEAPFLFLPLGRYCTLVVIIAIIHIGHKYSIPPCGDGQVLIGL